MRNLKKILALVLALMMVVSTMVFASAASYKDYADADEISAEYETAVAVLTGMGVFKGDEDGFRPQDTITRAEVSTSVYRVLSGDVSDSNVEVWKEYTMFDDVAADAWYAGFVNYAANVKWVIGVGDNKFDPSSDVTGYEMLAILLRALGYDQNGEFAKSDDWRIEVAAIAEKIDLTDVLVAANLNKAMTREQIAALMFQALQCETVTYTLALGYEQTGTLLGTKLFNLKPVTDKNDDWGRAQYGWSYSTGDKGTYWDYDYTLYTTPVVECDVAAETGVSGTVTTYTNGMVNKGSDIISETATKATIGAQGRQTYVYPALDRIVYIDTFLAQVTDVVASEVDGNGHLARKALLQLRVYNGVNGQNGQLVYKVSDTDWNYVRGDMLLVNAVTTTAASATVATTPSTPLGYSNQYNVANNLEIYAPATSFVGAQTYNQWNANTHTINGTVYNDALFYVRDDAGIDRTENFNWWKDQYGNVIGSTAIDRNSYAVLKDLIWIDGTPGYAQATLVNMDGTEYTATVSSIDGDDDYVAATVRGFDWDAINCVPTLSDSFQGNPFNTTGDRALVSSNSNYNGTYLGYALYLVTTLDNGNVVLTGSTTAGQTNTVINYVADGTLSANASTILANNGTTALAHIDDSTRIIVNNGDGTYSAYTRSTLPNLAGRSMEIFYSVVDGAFTQNVYIKRAVAQATFGDHLFTTSSSNYGHATADFADNRQVWEIPVVVDGVSTTIRTINTNIAAALTAQGNQGKLFHVTFDQAPLDNDGSVNETYGFVTNVDLVTEDTEGNDCDYLYPYTSIHLGNGSIECGNVSYNVSPATTIVELDGTTVAYDVQTLEDALKNSQLAVWVVESNNPATNVAATVYIGTKLSDNTALVNPTAVVGTGDDAKTYTGTWDTAARDTYTITVPHGTTTWTLTASANADYAYILTGTNGGTGYWTNLNGHAKNGTATFEDSTIVWAASNTATYSVTVFAENDAVSKAYTINVKVADMPNTAIGMLESVTLDGESQTVATGYTTVADAMANAIKIDRKGAATNSITITTKENSGDTELWASISVTADPNGAGLSFTGAAISGQAQNLTLTDDAYIVIRLENNWGTPSGRTDYAYYAYFITDSVG